MFNIQSYMLYYFLIYIQFTITVYKIINSVVTCILDISDTLKKAPDKYELHNLLANIRAMWYEIGICLRVSDNDLESIERNPISDTEKLSAVINKWEVTQSSPFTWATVISCIENPIVKTKGKLLRYVNILVIKVITI